SRHLRVSRSSGVGALISSLCFMSFLQAAEIISFRSEASLIFWGLVFVGLEIYLAWFPLDDDSTVGHSFCMQSSFCFIAVGKFLFVSGVAELWSPHHTWGVTIAILIIT